MLRKITNGRSQTPGVAPVTISTDAFMQGSPSKKRDASQSALYQFRKKKENAKEAIE